MCEKNGVSDIIEIVVGNDGISFAHAVSAADANFTKEQLWRALALKVDIDGKLVENPYKSWSDIDSSLPNKKIEILIAPPTSGTRDAWISLVMGKGCTKTAKSLKSAFKGIASEDNNAIIFCTGSLYFAGEILNLN